MESTLSPKLPETQSIMNFYRKYLLLYPESSRFTDITFVAPEERIKIMLSAASDAVERSDVLKQEAINCGLKGDIIKYWGLVKSGEVVLPSALSKAAYTPSQRGG